MNKSLLKSFKTVVGLGLLQMPGNMSDWKRQIYERRFFLKMSRLGFFFF